jgi:hypothetical protein
MGSLLLITVLTIVFVFWWHQRGMKDWALVLVNRRCARLGLQLLDETVQLVRLWPAREESGNWVLRRRYRFEFTSTGRERYPGEALLCGRTFVGLELPPYIWPDVVDEDVLGPGGTSTPPRLH